MKEADIVDGEEEEVREQIIGLVEEEVVAKVGSAGGGRLPKWRAALVKHTNNV